MVTSSGSSLRLAILLFNTRETLLVKPGETRPALSLPPVRRFVIQHGAVREDLSPALRDAVADRDVLTSCPVDSKPAQKEELLLFLLQLGARSVGIVSDCVLASFCYGVVASPCRVLLLGLDGVSCSAVDRGSVEYFTVSRTHGVAALLNQHPELGSNVSLADIDVEKPELRALLFQRHSLSATSSSSSGSIFLSLLRRLPKEYADSPILVGGEGAQLKGFACALRQHVKDLGFGEDVRALPDPSDAVLYGASLIGTLPEAELARLLVSREDVNVHGASIVHMRSP